MKALIIAILIILYCPNLSNADVKIKNTYQDREGFYSYAVVTFTNNTTSTLKLVSVICTAHSTSAKFSTSKSFYSLNQGITETFILEFFLEGLPLKKIHCYCVNWE